MRVYDLDKITKLYDIIDTLSTSSIMQAVIYIVLFLIIACVINIIITELIYRPIDKVSDERTVTAAITDKTVKVKNGSGKYLIFAKDEDGEIRVFEISDSIWKSRFDSSDLYGALKKGRTYKFTICGHRNELHSWYPNIYKAVEQK